MKFISHLDVMRYFQKVIKRADIDITYSAGFNPHQIMSFASPLGLGHTSEAEYVDIEVHSTLKTNEALNILNKVSVPDMEILSYKLLSDGATKAMTLVAAAEYFVKIREGYVPDFNLDNAINDFMSKDSIVVTKETKKGTKEVNLIPLIYEFRKEADGYFIKLAAGSVDNLKPELVFSTIYDINNSILPEFALMLERREIYGYDENGILKSLESFGDDIV